MQWLIIIYTIATVAMQLEERNSYVHRVKKKGDSYSIANNKAWKNCMATYVTFTTVGAWQRSKQIRKSGKNSWSYEGKILRDHALPCRGSRHVKSSWSDSWEDFTPPRAGVTLGRFLHNTCSW